MPIKDSIDLVDHSSIQTDIEIPLSDIVVLIVEVTREIGKSRGNVNVPKFSKIPTYHEASKIRNPYSILK